METVKRQQDVTLLRNNRSFLVFGMPHNSSLPCFGFAGAVCGHWFPARRVHDDGSPHRRSANGGGGLAVPASMEDAIEEV